MGCNRLLKFHLAAPAKIHYYISMLPHKQVNIIGLKRLIDKRVAVRMHLRKLFEGSSYLWDPHIVGGPHRTQHMAFH